MTKKSHQQIARELKTETFHQAKWNEPIIFELSDPTQQAVVANAPDEKVRSAGAPADFIPAEIRRKTPPALPQLGQMQVLKHFLRLSQENLGADFNIDIGQGTCTMKYSPKINESFVRSHKIADSHPLAPVKALQGTLEIYHKTDLLLREISGLDRFTFQPRSGTQGILAMASIIRKYHEANQPGNQRDQIITTMFSHPSDAAAAHVLGYEIITLQQDPVTGLPSFEDLQKAVGPRTAGLLITNPEDTGIFNPHIKKFTDLLHSVGALAGYDQANANGLLGITRAKEAGFDMCFFNLHKTFSVPHGCGGPACGAVGVVEKLIPHLPCPLVEFDGKSYWLNSDMPLSVGKIGSFLGVIPAVVRTYAWMRALGAAGLKKVAQIAVLNNNYLLSKITKITGASAPYAAGAHRIEQVRYSWQELHEQTGVSTHDITNRMCDHGMHMWSSHHPFIVPEPMTIEPTEAYAQAELDEYVRALESVAREAYTDPETVKTAPHRSCISQIDHSSFDDPQKWAMTWRAYKRKYPEEFTQNQSAE